MSTSTHFILLVEENPNEATLIQAAFRNSGFDHSFRTFHSPQDAIAYLDATRQHADLSPLPLPHLILLDDKLLGASSIITWVRRRPQLTNLPIVVLSGSANFDQRNEAYNLGANAYEIKPTTFEALVATAARIGTFWLRSFFPHPADQTQPSLPRHRR